MSFVTVVAISEIRKDKNNRNYKLLRMESRANKNIVDPATGEIIPVLARPTKTTITSYEQSYLDEAPDYLWDVEVGQKIYGTIVSREVAPYTFTGSDGNSVTVNRYKVFVEGTQMDDNFEELVARAFASAGRELAVDRSVKVRTAEAAQENTQNSAPSTSGPVTATPEEAFDAPSTEEDEKAKPAHAFSDEVEDEF